MTRLHCLVPGCKRTLLPDWPDDTAGICSKHWQTLHRNRRAAYRRRRREMAALRERINLDYPNYQPDDVAAFHRVRSVMLCLWRSLERQAIERSVGI